MAPARVQAAANRQDILREMRQHGIPLTAENYAVWQEYHESGDTRLRRAIDILLSNGRVPDQQTLHRLYAKHCAPVQETAALRDIAQRALETLHLVTGMLGDMQGAAADYGESLRHAEAGMAASAQDGATKTSVLKPLLDRLAGETCDMIRHSKSLVRRLTQSAERIEELEQFLSEARREAATDPLTGLANRRAFEAALLERAACAMDTGHPLAVLIADVDHFKTVNDRWGHDTGDAVLRMVANCLRQGVRGRDIVARHGGEEFSIILPDTTLAGAHSVAENLRVSVGQSHLVLEASTTVLTVTISVGATTTRQAKSSLKPWRVPTAPCTARSRTAAIGQRLHDPASLQPACRNQQLIDLARTL